MCLELLKEYYGGHSVEAQALRDNLITVYAIGWAVTQEMTETYPQIVPAAGEMDTGVAVSFDCEDGTLTDTLVIPEGTKALSIDPLNWKTDGTLADRSLNVGAVTETDAEPIPALCGAYIGGRGELAVTDVTPEEYPSAFSQMVPITFMISTMPITAWCGSWPGRVMLFGGWMLPGSVSQRLSRTASCRILITPQRILALRWKRSYGSRGRTKSTCWAGVGAPLPQAGMPRETVSI